MPARKSADWYVKNSEDGVFGIEQLDEQPITAPPHKSWLQEVPPWHAVAFGALRAYCAARYRGHAFQSADFLTWVSRYRWIRKAPDARAWGVVFLKAANENLIEHAGYERCKSKSRHGAPSTLWRVK